MATREDDRYPNQHEVVDVLDAAFEGIPEVSAAFKELFDALGPSSLGVQVGEEQ